MNMTSISFYALIFLATSLSIAVVIHDFRRKLAGALLILSVISIVLFMIADRLNNFSFFFLLTIAIIAFGVNKVRIPWAKAILIAFFLTMTIAVSLHIIPGISNFLLFENIQISDQAKSINIWANIDKGLAGLFLLIFLVTQNEYRKEPHSNKCTIVESKSTLQAWALIPLYVVSMMLVGVVFGLDIDTKIPKSTLVFFLSNLLFSVIAEEVFFRGVVQQTLQRAISGKIKHSQFVAIVVASVIFGAAHFGGGLQFAILSTIAGLFYGYAYFSTGKISAAIITHSGVNICHFLLLDYPAA